MANPDQDGVVARRQLAALGLPPNDIRRMLRRRELTTVHPGVYVDHTGPLTRTQREWAAVLACWPAALSHRSALPTPRLAAQTGAESARVQVGIQVTGQPAVHIAVSGRRSLRAPQGVVVHRMACFDRRVHPASWPPRIRIEHAAIDVAEDLREPFDRFALLAEVVATRQTTPGRLASVLAQRRGVRDRRLLLDLLDDLGSGACSVLEREYLHLEQRHGLPGGRSAARQSADLIDGSRIYRDVDYPEQGVVVELDGRAGHDSVADRDRDARRDLATLVETDRPTVRLTYGLVLRDGCRSVAAIASLLTRRGWPGPFLPCPRCPGPLNARSGVSR